MFQTVLEKSLGVAFMLRDTFESLKISVIT